MTTDTPLVTIGLPVYNGLPFLEVALKALLAQDYPNIELLISDNASQDGTAELCRQLCRERVNAHYHRNSENLGAARNFHRVLAEARGTCFMWAAHDDKWDPHFVTALVECLEAHPAARLATPMVIHIHPDGSVLRGELDRPAPDSPGIAQMKTLCEDHAAGWLYGLYRTAWLREHIHEMDAYPPWGCDVLWLADLCLRGQVAGSQDAIFYKRLGRSSFAPRTARAAVIFCGQMFWHYARICLHRTRGFKTRARAIAISWHYVYRLCIQRPNLPRTLWRVVRMLSLAAIESVPPAVGWLWRRIAPSGTPRAVEAQPVAYEQTPKREAA